jgi:hypothetical protein
MDSITSRIAVLSAMLAAATSAQNDVAPLTDGFAPKLPPSAQFAPAGIGEIYNNGPYINLAPNQSVLQNQLPPVSLGMGILGFGGRADILTLLDDFTVTDPVGWRIDQLEVYAYQTSAVAATINGIYIQIWNGNPTMMGSSVIWGNLVTNRLASATFGPNLRVTETTLGATARTIQIVVGNVGKILGPGTYWIEYGVTGTSPSGPFLPPITITGTTTTGNALQRTLATNTFVAVADPGPTGGTGPYPQGMPFRLIGDTMTPPCYETNLGTPLMAGDDTLHQQMLPFSFPFPGGMTSAVGICSNGFVWLAAAQTSTDFSPSVAEFLGAPTPAPRLCAAWRDLDASVAGSDDVYFNTFGTSRAVITWHNVRRFSGTIPMTVQLQMLSDGSYYVYYDVNYDLTGGASLCGIKAATGVVTDPGATDYSAALPISTTVSTVYEFFATAASFDLRGRCIKFTPNTMGGYDVSFRNDCGAAVNAYGVGCPAGTPLTLAASAPPILGTTFNYNVTNVALGADAGALLLGLGVTNISLTALGFTGCSAYNTMNLPLALPLTPPTATLPATVPISVQLIGMELHAQAAVVKNTAPTSTHTSNGLTTVFGKR